MNLSYRAYSLLLVDDDPAVLASFRLAYEEDFTVLTCSDPEEALRIVRAEASMAVLLCDQRMPAMSGTELLRRARELRPDLIRMMITAYSDLDAVVNAVNQGQISRYIVKPWRHDDLLASLKSAIEVYDLSRRIRDLQLEVFRGSNSSVTSAALEKLVREIQSPLGAARAQLTLLTHGLRELMIDVPRSAAEPEIESGLGPRMAEMHAAATTAFEAATLMRAILGRSRVPKPARPFAEVDVEALVVSMARLLRAQDPALVVEISVEAGLPVTRSDPTVLSQIVLRLLSQAGESSPRLPGDAASEHARVVKAHLRRDGGELVLGIEPGEVTALAVAQDLAAQIDATVEVRPGEPAGLQRYELRLPIPV